MTTFKICAEASCGFVYEPDREGRCPKCGSEGLYIENTVLGTRGNVFVTEKHEEGEGKK